jgi:hypothetical protein
MRSNEKKNLITENFMRITVLKKFLSCRTTYKKVERNFCTRFKYQLVAVVITFNATQ